ncbi:pyridoxamine 5'-phosphate oxidase family protein [[Clostridium] symbiosum]|uniref:pyridoxamine 5'-phosphate oxidase family protein n=1 Tax=Clostridium symbiosum TaxID=1512 RepID=UPI001D08D1A9|nr:pyridoxamine 5'-phosphate oxidase family protein [[Clostridium] symbiosum]MCB6611543.1 hypothetical protein [[Clostridium] symbiosum]MCB6929053.1 hypothetical protein [[Clostridium] symbiosum]
MNVNLNELQKTLAETEVISLATSADDLVTVRQVSPLSIGLLLYVRTSLSSRKAIQMMENPNVAVCVENFYFTGRSELLGKVTLPENEEIKNAYRKRYPESFSEDDEFIQDDEVFFLIRIRKVSQWVYENNIPVGLAELKLEE